MKRIHGLLRSFCILVLVLFVCLAGAHLAAAQDSPKYLKVHIHYQQQSRDAKAAYSNWTDPRTGHMILPVNTPIKIGKFHGGFSIISLPDNKEILFDCNEGNMHMTIEQYLPLITSPTPVELNKFSELDRKGIADGKAYVGMTKQGVMTALGYPAAHRTPSPDANTWTYWRDRFGNFTVQFDDKGLVTAVGH